MCILKKAKPEKLHNHKPKHKPQKIHQTPLMSFQNLTLQNTFWGIPARGDCFVCQPLFPSLSVLAHLYYSFHIYLNSMNPSAFSYGLKKGTVVLQKL